MRIGSVFVFGGGSTVGVARAGGSCRGVEACARGASGEGYRRREDRNEVRGPCGPSRSYGRRLGVCDGGEQRREEVRRRDDPVAREYRRWCICTFLQSDRDTERKRRWSRIRRRVCAPRLGLRGRRRRVLWCGKGRLRGRDGRADGGLGLEGQDRSAENLTSAPDGTDPFEDECWACGSGPGGKKCEFREGTHLEKPPTRSPAPP